MPQWGQQGGRRLGPPEPTGLGAGQRHPARLEESWGQAAPLPRVSPQFWAAGPSFSACVDLTGARATSLADMGLGVPVETSPRRGPDGSGGL